MGKIRSKMKSKTNLEYTDDVISSILNKTKTIAIIGLSSSWNRPSYFVAKYLIDRRDIKYIQ